MRSPDRLSFRFFHFILIANAFVLLICSACGKRADTPPIITDAEHGTLEPEQLAAWASSLAVEAPLSPIRIIEPLSGTVFPTDLASPAIRWEDSRRNSAWLITIRGDEEALLKVLTSSPWWIPDPSAWKRLKMEAGHRHLELIVSGIGGWTGRQITSRGSSSFKFSKDRLDARILYMQKPLPFQKAKQNPEKTRILAADPASYDPPCVLLANPPVCVNCHSYSQDGRRMTLDTDFGGDKGAFWEAPLQDTCQIQAHQVYSWNVLVPRKPSIYSMGLFSRLSPDGAFLAGTVDETSVFVMMEDLFFSQLFFPATGRIGIFDTKTKCFFRLPGADLDDRVHTAPAWHPDGKTLAFSVAPLNPDLVAKVSAQVIRREKPAQTIAALNKKYPVQFDIYTMPFNNGEGGRAAPLEGAAGNGRSNYFPRFSPDGKWLVFTQSPTGLVLQPDSRLLIIPAAGGTARVLRCNLPVMNSWHSWSPNSKWIVFTSKANSPYTELYLTHIDDRGESSPAIRLFRLSRNDLAAMVPEFFPKTVDLPESMRFASMADAKGTSMAIDGR